MLQRPVPRAASWSLPIWATDPRNAGKALLYALNKLPGAKSACGTKGQSVSQIQEVFQLMEHFPVHQLHNYLLSQEITSR